MKDNITNALYQLNEALQHLEDTPEKENLYQLIKACQEIEFFYKKWCINNDKGKGIPIGTTYELGVNLPFIIESMDWHNVSLALRGL